jgi:hypothetical protein
VAETKIDGRHDGGLFVEASGVYTGENGAVVDAGDRGAALHVTEDETDVVVRDVRLTGGRSELGGGVRVDAWAVVTLEDCVIEGNHAREGGACGAGIRAGEVHFVRTRFGNADDVLIKGACEVEFERCDVAGDVRIQDGATVRFIGGRVGGKVSVVGNPTRVPTVHFDGTEVAMFENDDEFPGEVTGL